MAMKIKKIIACISVALTATVALCGCVNQNSYEAASNGTTQQPKIAATSVAVMEICQKLDLDLVGVPKSSLTEIPSRYSNAVSLGSPMSPDMELLAQCDPDWVLSPSSLMSDLKPKYEAAGLQYAFLNLTSVQGMYKSISQMGDIFNREEEAQKLVDDFLKFYNSYKDSHKGKKSPQVLILMGLPGSYVVATENSYVGSLVELAGGTNVYSGTDDEFLNVNTEDMLKKDPDIILRTAHAMPDSVKEMFAEEFKSNDIWKNFRAVNKNQVYDLPYESCGMSANFRYQEALSAIDNILYAQNVDLK